MKEMICEIKSRFSSLFHKGKETQYMDLAPLEDLSVDNPYIEALDWALNNSKTNNVALSGPYGSGKSSVINSYIKRHKRLKYATVSLTTFEKNAQSSSDDKNKSSDDLNSEKFKIDLIEEEILKQLFYSVNYRDIPHSRYRKLHNTNLIIKIIRLLFLVVVIPVLICLFSPNVVSKFTEFIANFGDVCPIPRRVGLFIVLAFCLLIDIVLANCVVWILEHLNLLEFKWPSFLEISAKKDDSHSVFNKNLDEIVYLFETMKYNVVFFEDLDRFCNADVFIKLRELNIILNNKKGNRVTFVYAVRDDIFMSVDRTKFFDFIIPIVPIINSTNSGEEFSEIIERNGFSDSISEEYILDVTPFISDMRLLRNIFNEFLIYKKTLQIQQSLELEDHKIMSLIIFKNLYPKDFSDLQNEKGIVKDAFETVESYCIPNKETYLSNIRNSCKEVIASCGTSMFSKEVQANDFLVFLLRKGYIDENYVSYMNYFKGKSITPSDMNFILSVKRCQSQPFNYNLTKVDIIISKLNFHEFKQVEVLNFDLLDCLLGNEAYLEKRNLFIKEFKNASSVRWQFFDEFAARTIFQEKFYSSFSTLWVGMWDYIYHKEELTYERRVSFLEKILIYADISDIVIQNANGNISSFFVDNENILIDLHNVPAAKITNVIRELDIKFVDVDLSIDSEEVAAYIVENSQYKLCMAMFVRIAQHFYPDFLEDIQIKNYTTILRIDNSIILDYIHENWIEYVTDVLSFPSNAYEDVDAILDALTLTGDKTVCTNILENQKFYIETLSDFVFKDDKSNSILLLPVWNSILKQEKVTPNWNNILSYWEKFGMTEHLLKYIDKKCSVLCLEEVGELDDAFVHDYYLSDGDIDAYRVITACFRKHEFKIPIKQLSEERVDVLIENRIIPFDAEKFMYINSCFPSLSAAYVYNNQNEFWKQIENVRINSGFIERIMVFDGFSCEFIGKLLITFADRYMSDSIAEKMCQCFYPVNSNVFWLAWKQLLDENRRKELLFQYMSILNDKDFEICFSEITEFVELSKRQKQHVVYLSHNVNNQKLVQRLMEIGYLTDGSSVERNVKGDDIESSKQVMILCRVRKFKG